MVTASGWRREDAVVSDATRRLQNWVASGLWSATEVEEGAPLLAQALGELLGAHGVLLLVRTPQVGWQPASLAEGKGSAQMFPLEESALPWRTAAHVLDNAPGEPLMQDEWSESQNSLVQEAREVLREAMADSNTESTAHENTAATSIPIAGSVDADTFVEAAAALDSNNNVADWMHASALWYNEEPSLLLPLFPFVGEEEQDAGSSNQACGAVLAWVKSEDGFISDEWRPLWSACAQQAAAWVQRSLRLERVGRSYRDLANLVARVVDARDPRRSGHGPLVAHACVLMARALGLPEREVEEWEMAGLMHGIGRVPVPDAVLQKQGALAPEERDAIRASMQEGAQWLSEVEGWDNVARLVKYAGERWDGHGYPEELEGEAIPLGSRAIAIAARFCALSQGRPERGAMGSLHNVGAALESEAGRALDPRLTSLFLGALRGGAR